MKPGAGIATLLLGFALVPGELPAADAGEPVKAPKTRVHQQLNQLIRQQVGVVQPAPAPVEDKAAVAAGETLMLEPMIVEESKLKEKDLPPPETKVAKFFRTGTIWEKVGRTFTQRFWLDGSRGLCYTLSW